MSVITLYLIIFLTLLEKNVKKHILYWLKSLEENKQGILIRMNGLREKWQLEKLDHLDQKLGKFILGNVGFVYQVMQVNCTMAGED